MNAAGESAWEAFAARVAAWAEGEGIALRDALVLLPFGELLAPARAAFARRGGWPARIETPRTLAASLGPAPPAAPQQPSFDAAADRLVAARLLRAQAIGQALARSDPRRFDHAVDALVETAHAFARAAHQCAPRQREAWWAQARERLAPTTGPGTQQRWLARIALEWAALANEADTDRLFALRPSAWIVLRAGGPDRLAQALLDAAAAVPCLVVDADAGLPAVPREPPALARCDDVEHEAQCAAAQVLAHLERGEAPVALVGLDRQLVRRVRALLERQNVPLADETGWTLSTTRAAALVMSLLRSAAPRAGTDALFDWLKALPEWPGVPEFDARVRALERACRRLGVARVERLGALPDYVAPDLVAPLDAVLAPLRAPRRPVAEWLEALRAALQASGGWAWLAADEAGRAVLRALRLDAEGPAAWREATGAARLGLDGFAAWVDAAFEAQTFKPAAPPAEAVKVVITPLAQVMLRPFAALVCPGADDRHLGAPPATHPLLSDAELAALGLPDRAQRRERESLAFAHALALPRVTLLRRHADASGETLADSPLLQRLALDLAAQGRSFAAWHDPRVATPLAAEPLARPLPVAAQALPARLSASAVEALRDCPYRFFARHVLGLREDDELEAALEKRDYGTWLHGVLLAFHRERGAGASVEHDAERLRALAAQQQAEMGLADDEFLPFAASFERFVPAYLAWLHARDAEGALWQDGERACRLRPEAFGGIELEGRIDRIDRVAQGAALELIDYKTSSAQRLRGKVAQPLEDTQLAVYAALLAPEADVPLRACYLPLDQPEAIKPIVHPQVQHSAEVLVRELGAEFARLRAGAPLPALGEAGLCETCEARGLCRRDHWPDGGEA
ncbi:PD-(D/E)XK nuclease family protein [Piscinibacter sp.]|uniref:PD-(D/E)XK nuclease family protein n=1 Tax=Piscinibacter sp. TaxID=1903157 RepID=UPI0039E52692